MSTNRRPIILTFPTVVEVYYKSGNWWTHTLARLGLLRLDVRVHFYDSTSPTGLTYKATPYGFQDASLVTDHIRSRR